jgi:hypothetical protein
MEEQKRMNTGHIQSLIQHAEEVVGRDDPNDYRIRPKLFPEQLEKSAPELSAVLRHASLTETARRYEEQDAHALDTQKSFTQLSKYGTYAVFVATVAAALLASLTPVFPTKNPSPLWQCVVIFLGFCSFGGGVVAAVVLYRIKNEGLLKGWMNARAAAESERLGYFNRLTRLMAKDHAQNPPLMLLFLEFFRRYQVAVQQIYYRDRSASHRNSRRETVIIGAVAVAILSVGSGGFGIFASFRPEILPLAALGTIGAALTMVASRREELNQDERNAERYQRTYGILSHIRENHTDVQQAIANGKSEILLKYVDAVHEQVSLEHRQWQEDIEAMDSAIRELSTSLEALRNVGNEAAGEVDIHT